jgi:hypothetical protein
MWAKSLSTKLKHQGFPRAIYKHQPDKEFLYSTFIFVLGKSLYNMISRVIIERDHSPKITPCIARSKLTFFNDYEIFNNG